MKTKLLSLCALAVAGAFAAVPASAAMSGSVGLGVHAYDLGYKDTDAVVYPIPAINVESEHFYFKGLEAGAFLFKNERHRVMLGVSYMPWSFDASDSDNHQVKLLDDRDASFFANATYAFDTGFGLLTASLGADISGKSEGMMSEVSFMKRFAFGQFGITPQVGAIWTSEKFNEYYYGVSHAEANRSGLSAYSPDAGVSPYVRLMGDWQMGNNWSLYAETTVRAMSKEIKDSPMVEDDAVVGFGVGVSYRF